MNAESKKINKNNDHTVPDRSSLLLFAAAVIIVVSGMLYWQKIMIPYRIERLSVLVEETAKCNYEYKEMLDKYLKYEEEFKYEVEIVSAYADEQAKKHQKYKRNAGKLYERYEELFASKKRHKEECRKKYREIIMDYNRTQKTYEQWKKERLSYLLDDETSYDIKGSGKKVKELRELMQDGNVELRVRIDKLKNDYSVLKELEAETDKILTEHKKYAKIAKEAFEEYSKLDKKSQDKQKLYTMKLADYRDELDVKKKKLDALEKEIEEINNFPGVRSRINQ